MQCDATVAASDISRVTNRARADWTRIEHSGGSLDLLEVRAISPKTWCFVWPGRIVIQALSSGVSSSHLDRGAELRPGSVIVADAFSAQMRISATSGAAFRVLFEHVDGTEAGSRGRVRPPLAGPTLPVDTHPADLFRAATASAAPPLSLAKRVASPAARARDYIEQNVASDFDLEALGAAVGVDRCHLCRVFQRAVGLPPQRFRAHLRVARARALLAAGLDCTEVAYAVGFCDQSHLSRCFKELTGTTPGAYAKACRAPLAAWRSSSAA